MEPQTIKRDAQLVQELLDKCLQMETADRKRDYEGAAKWFREKHNRDWQSFIAQSLPPARRER